MDGKEDNVRVDRTILRQNLIESEGKRNKAYLDSVGKITIGIGRNLDDVGLSEKEVEYLFQNDLTSAINGAMNLFPNLFAWSENRQHALIEMVFNLGESGVRKFRKMREAISVYDWEKAANEALDSKWAKQVGKRAERLAMSLRNG